MNIEFFSWIEDILKQSSSSLDWDWLENWLTRRFTSKMKGKMQKKANKLLGRYNALRGKYNKRVLLQTPLSWHDNERKVFVQFVVWYSNWMKRKFHQFDQEQWDRLSKCFFDKDQVILKYQCKLIQRDEGRVNWSQQEEQILAQSVQRGLLGNWNDISRSIFFLSAGLHFKTSKHCRQHWLNHLDKQKRKGPWHQSEDQLLLESVQRIGKKWSSIARLLVNSRTQHMTKNRFNSIINGVRRKIGNQKMSDDDLIIIALKYLREDQKSIIVQKSDVVLLSEKDRNSEGDKQDQQLIQIKQKPQIKKERKQQEEFIYAPIKQMEVIIHENKQSSAIVKQQNKDVQQLNCKSQDHFNNKYIQIQNRNLENIGADFPQAHFPQFNHLSSTINSNYYNYWWYFGHYYLSNQPVKIQNFNS